MSSKSRAEKTLRRVVPALLVAGVAAVTFVGDRQDGEKRDELPAGRVVARDNAFAVSDKPVYVGDTVVFTNEDDTDHSFTADDGLFDSRVLRSGRQYGFTFPRAGLASFHCEIHPAMTGAVNVLPR